MCSRSFRGAPFFAFGGALWFFACGGGGTPCKRDFYQPRSTARKSQDVASHGARPADGESLLESLWRRLRQVEVQLLNLWKNSLQPADRLDDFLLRCSASIFQMVQQDGEVRMGAGDRVRRERAKFQQ